MGAATGGGGGRGAKGRKRGPGKSELRKFKPMRLGEGVCVCPMCVGTSILGKGFLCRSVSSATIHILCYHSCL